MSEIRSLELPIEGMDCTECTLHVQHAIEALPGVESVGVYLASEKAVIRYDPARVELPAFHKAVEEAGYSVRQVEAAPAPSSTGPLNDFNRRLLSLLALVFGLVLFVVVVGEWLGLFERVTERVPWPIGVAVVIAGGYPVFRNVVRSALRRQVTSHTLMTLGVLASLAVGQWATAVVVVMFMRIGDYTESFTTERARRAVKDLTELAPRTARLAKGDQEVEVPIAEVQPGDTVIVRPGEIIPVDGEVIDGQATIDQATITGESMPVEASPGTRVYAATIAQLGHLRICVSHVGADTTFGHVIQMVEDAEGNRANVQRIADKFSGYYLPVVAGIAALTFIIRRDPLATAAVLVVACSCSIALATPIAMLASIGAGAKRGLLIKGGRYLELLAQADTVLIDKTGTLTLGKPQITDVVPLDGLAADDLLTLVGTAERYSEHPLAEAVRTLAKMRNLPLGEPEDFQTMPGIGVSARVDGAQVAVGSRRLLNVEPAPPPANALLEADRLEAQGKTLLFVQSDGRAVGLLAADDTLRPEVPAAITALRNLGVRYIELLTGDNERTAASVAGRLGVGFRANLLPEDKIRIVRAHQDSGHKVVMVGDGVNDAPALAQAEVGIAMGAAGTDIAMEAGHIVLMREDWALVPQAFRIAQRTMRIVKMNLWFTGLYNLVGLTLAATGILPPILAAAAQSLPDLGILGNSSRLLKQGE